MKSVTVEVLFIRGCPNHVPAVHHALEALRQEGFPAEVVEREIGDTGAPVIGFLGSPSIRVGGRDVERAVRGCEAAGYSCRRYVHEGKPSGVPPVEWIRNAIREEAGDRQP